jgi:hypothetical protein
MTATAAPDAMYTQLLAKGGVMVAETRALLRAWRPGMSESALFDAALRDDLLGMATSYRVRNVVAVFAMRYLRPDEAPARHLKRIIDDAVLAQTYLDLLFLYTARRDGLLREFTLRRYWPAVREGRLLLTTRDVEQFILEGEGEGRTATRWSEPNRQRMARVVVAALTDVGLLREHKPGKREIVPYRPADATVVYLAHLLHDRGVTDSSLAGQAEWALLGLEAGDVWNRLESLAADGWFVLQRAGQVARITWRCASVEEAVDALAR